MNHRKGSQAPRGRAGSRERRPTTVLACQHGADTRIDCNTATPDVIAVAHCMTTGSNESKVQDCSSSNNLIVNHQSSFTRRAGTSDEESSKDNTGSNLDLQPAQLGSLTKRKRKRRRGKPGERTALSAIWPEMQDARLAQSRKEPAIISSSSGVASNVEQVMQDTGPTNSSTCLPNESWDNDFIFEKPTEVQDTLRSPDPTEGQRSWLDGVEDLDAEFWDEKDKQELLRESSPPFHLHLPRASSSRTIKADGGTELLRHTALDYASPSSQRIQTSNVSDSQDSSGTEIGFEDIQRDCDFPFGWKQSVQQDAEDPARSPSTQTSERTCHNGDDNIVRGLTTLPNDSGKAKKGHQRGRGKMSLSFDLTRPWKRYSQSKEKVDGQHRDGDNDRTDPSTKTSSHTSTDTRKSGSSAVSQTDSMTQSKGKGSVETNDNTLSQSSWDCREDHSASNSLSTGSLSHSERFASDHSSSTGATSHASDHSMSFSPQEKGLPAHQVEKSKSRRSSSLEKLSQWPTPITPKTIAIPESNQVHATRQSEELSTDLALRRQCALQVSEPDPGSLSPKISIRSSRSNSVGDFKVPARISNTQSALKTEISRFKIFAKGVQDLKKMQTRHEGLLAMISQLDSGTGDTACQKIEDVYRSWWECADVIVNLGDGRDENSRLSTSSASIAGSYASSQVSEHESTSTVEDASPIKNFFGEQNCTESPTTSCSTRGISPGRERDILSSILGIDAKSEVDDRRPDSSSQRKSSSLAHFDDPDETRALAVSSTTTRRESLSQQVASGEPSERSQTSTHLEGLSCDMSTRTQERMGSYGNGGFVALRRLLEIVNVSPKSSHLEDAPRHRTIFSISSQIDVMPTEGMSNLHLDTKSDHREILKQRAEKIDETNVCQASHGRHNQGKLSSLLEDVEHKQASQQTSMERELHSKRMFPSFSKQRQTVAKLLKPKDRKGNTLASSDTASYTCLEQEHDAGRSNAYADYCSSDQKTGARILLKESITEGKASNASDSIAKETQASERDTIRPPTPSEPLCATVNTNEDCERSQSRSSRTSSHAEDAATMRKLAMKPEAMTRLIEYLGMTRVRCRDCIEQLERVHAEAESAP